MPITSKRGRPCSAPFREANSHGAAKDREPLQPGASEPLRQVRPRGRRPARVPEAGGEVRGDQAKTREDFVAAVGFLKSRPESTGRVGVIGFCFGGGIANMLATRIHDLAAAVPFYGMQPTDEEVARIHAPLLIHYAEHDDRIDAGIPVFEASLKAHKVDYQLFTYPGTQHGFNNDTTPRYDEAAAKLAWSRTLDFFNRYLLG
jgi:carboxymethylenebutenolidase